MRILKKRASVHREFRLVSQDDSYEWASRFCCVLAIWIVFEGEEEECTYVEKIKSGIKMDLACLFFGSTA